MAGDKESIVRGQIRSTHTVQLFDARESLATSVAEFLLVGFRADSHVLVVVRPANWKAIAQRLEAAGQPVAAATDAGQLTVCDAAKTLGRFMRRGRVVPRLFERVVARLVEDVAARSAGGLAAYGEMVDILAEERNFDAARRLEELWNDLAARTSFSLLCGYASAHFADAEAMRLVPGILRQHSHIAISPEDSMGQWILARQLANVPPAPEVHSPSISRRPNPEQDADSAC